jgi:DnaJ-class molecular chaperone
MTCERPPPPMPHRVQANQTLDVGAVLAPRNSGGGLAMSDVNAELLAKDRVCEGCRGGGSITIGGTHVCKSCNGIGYLCNKESGDVF